MLRFSRSVNHARGFASKNVLHRRCISQSQTAKAPETKSSPPVKEAPLPPPLPKKSGGLFVKLLALTIGTAGGAVAYAWYDPKFKKQVEDNVPYSKEALDFMFNYLPETGQEVVKKTEQTISKKPKDGFGVSEADKEAMKQGSMMPAKYKQQSEAKTEKPKEELTAKQKKEAEKHKKEEEAKRKKQQEIERMEKQRQLQQAEEAAENAALETILAQCLQESKDVLDMALEAQKSAASAIREHSKELKKAMDSTGEVEGTEGQWETVTIAHTARYEASEAAEKLAQKARLQIEKIKAAVEDGKEHAVTKRNQKLREAEEKLKQVKYDLEGAVAEVNKAQSEARVMKEYRNLIKKGKEQFKKELESLMPEVKIKEGWGGKMSEDDLNSLIAHAHRRIEQLQKQIAEQQALERLRIEAALEKQREEDDKLAAARVNMEQDKMKSEFEIEKELWDTKAKIQTEDAIRHQLARQAAAHSDHLAQVLKIQERELEAEYAVLVQDRLMEARDQFNTEIAGHIARLKGIEAAVEGRAELEKQGRKAQELWLACQTLSNIIEIGKEDAETYEQQMKPLANEVMAIREAGDNHPFVNTLVESFPEVAAVNGVYTEDALVERFKKVTRICRRVAMINDTNNTLFRYFMSYVQSMFVFTQGKPMSEDDEFDPIKLSVFAILDNAAHYIEKGDLEQALRFMNLLSGEPRNVARDWIRDTRLLLETKQASDVLLGHASASGLGSLF